MSFRPFRTVLLTLALGLAAQAACSDATTAPESGDRAELTRNRELWRASGYAEYRFTSSRSCFCITDVTQPARVVVRGDSIISVTAVSDGRTLDPQYFMTVEDLFEFISNAIDQRAVLLRVVYDPVLGYPREIDYDGATMIADDEMWLRASEVTRTP